MGRTSYPGDELAQKILIEERTFSTVRYLLREPVAHAAAPAALALTEKGNHPRTVREKAGHHLFSSENYTLLAGLYAELDDVGRARVVEILTARIGDGGAYRDPTDNVRGCRLAAHLPLGTSARCGIPGSTKAHAGPS